MRTSFAFASVVFLLSSAFLSSALAQDNSVTVYATRKSQSVFDSPASVAVIDAGEAGNVLSSDAADLFEFTAGVDVNSGPRRNGQTVTVRGFDDEAVLTLIDGRRQNFESAHDGRFYIDPLLLKSVEVVRGSSSAAYGSGAVGGVVAFETKDAADMLLDGRKFGVTTAIGGRTGNSEFSSLLSAYSVVDDFDVIASASYRTDRDIKLGRRAADDGVLNNENNLVSGLFKIGKSFKNFHNVKFEYQGSDNNGQEPNNGNGEVTSSNPILNKDISDNQFALKYSYENPFDKSFATKVHLYRNQTEVEEQDISGSNVGRIQAREMVTNGLKIDNISEIALGEKQTHSISYGLEYYEDEQTGTNSFVASGARAGVPNAEADTLGIYLQNDIALKTDIGDFEFIPAARYDRFESADEVGNSQDEGRVSPKFSAAYKPNKNVNIFGSWAQAFRAPNLTELYPAGQHFPGVSFGPRVIFPNNNFVANPDLRSEVVETFEVGLGLKFGDTFLKGDKFSVKGSYYGSVGEDFITQEVNLSAGTTRNFNVAEASIRGFEIESRYEIQNFVAKFGLSYTEAENAATGEYLANNVPLTFVSDLSYKVDSINSLFGFRSRFVDKNDKAPDNEVQTAGYSVHDLYYRFTAPNSKGEDVFFIDLGIENIFDKSYIRRFASLREEGRSFNGRIVYKW